MQRQQLLCTRSDGWEHSWFRRSAFAENSVMHAALIPVVGRAVGPLCQSARGHDPWLRRRAATSGQSMPLNSPLANPCNWNCARKGIGCTAPCAAQSSSIPSTSASGIPAFRLLSGATTARAGRLMSHSALLDDDWSTTPCLQPQRRPSLLFPSHLVAPPRGRTKAGARLRVPPACAVAVCLPRAAAARPCCRWLCWLVLPSAHCKPKLVAARNG